jgi:hypothetical protein
MSHDKMKGKRVYIFGPMSNVGPEGNWNFPAFERAALYLAAIGAIPVCPSRIDKAVWGFDGTGDLRPGQTYKRVMGVDMYIIPTCDMGYGLRGWSESGGSMPEIAYMQCLGMPIEFEAGAERGRVGFVADPIWERAYIKELEDWIVQPGISGRISVTDFRSRDEILQSARERASQATLPDRSVVPCPICGQLCAMPKPKPLEETREIPRHPDAGHDCEEG